MSRIQQTATEQGRHRPLRLGAGAAALLLMMLLPPRADAQAPASLFGRVTDQEDAVVPDVVVTLTGPGGAPSRRTALTGRTGEYRFVGLAPGSYLLRADRLGFTAGERQVALAAGQRLRLDLRLRVDTVRVEGVVVRGRSDRDRERARFETEPGVTARVVGGAELKTLPGLAEPDVLRAIELLPGVVSTSDFSSAFNVRGGSADQNLIQLDGFPIFNPFHLGGLFSVFNSDAVARAELLAGGFGAEYGGRVSSVLNVESDAAAPDGLEVEGGVSLLATRLLVRSRLPDAVSGALGGSGGSWFVSARRSYFDVLFRPVVDFPYHLTDLQGYAGVGTRGGGRLSVTAYGGDDVLDLSDFEAPGADGDSTSFLRVRWNWGNRVVGVRWEQPVGRDWATDTRLGYSAFADRLGFVDFGDVRFASEISQASLRSDWTRDLGPESSLRVGAALDRMGYHNLAEAGGTTFFSGRDHGLLGAAYASVRLQPGSWILEPGVRVDAWHSGGGSRTVVAPRLAAKRFLGPDRAAAVKLAVGRYSQFLHSLRDEQLPISNDTWVLAGRSVPPVVSDQVQVGLEAYWGESWSASVEGYLRNFEGVTEFNVADNPNDPADDLVAGSGRSYGLDLLLRRSAGRLTGWTTVSLLRAERTLPDPLTAGWEDLPAEVTFAPVYDRRMDVDVVLQYLLPWQVELGARWNYGSPLPYSRPVGQYFAWRHSPLSGQLQPGDRRGNDEPPLYVVVGRRNAERYPPYHRLDLTLRRTFRPRWGEVTPYLQVLNAYNRRDNVLFYFYNYDRVPPTRSGLSMFPLLPAVGVEFSF